MKWSLDQFVNSLAPLSAGSILRSKRRFFISAGVILLIAAATLAWYIKLQARRELDAARVELETRAYIPFERRALRGTGDRGIRLIQNIRYTRDLVQFGDSYFAATEGGLVEFDLQGKFRKHYTVLDGLPESDLTCLASFGSKLFIGTRSQGLVVFDGKRFEGYRWPDRKVQAVTALLEDRGRLLIGTFAGGLIEFDGDDFKEIKPGSVQDRFKGVNCLAVDGSRLYVGTFADGLWISEAGRWAHFTVAEGLPSNRIVGVEAGIENLIVATDFGLAAVSNHQIPTAGDSSRQAIFQILAVLPSLSSLANYSGAVLLSKDNGEIFQLVPDTRSNGQFQLAPLGWNRPQNLSSSRIVDADKRSGAQSRQMLWLLSGQGMWLMTGPGERFSKRVELSPFGKTGVPEPNSGELTSNLISSLALDESGRLWAGSFRNGIDIFAPEGRRLAHLESESIREINSLVWDREKKQMLAATSQGMMRFDSSLPSGLLAGQAEERLDRRGGLLSNSVSHVAVVSNKDFAAPADGLRLILATNRGLSLGDVKRWKVLTTTHGLPGSGVYAVLPHREFIYAGTLNGLAQIAGGRVRRVFNDSNSRLSQNWVTSLCSIGSRVFAGTYGGGVFELTPAGEFVSFVSEIGRQSVNPNAMATDGRLLYVGTLDGAWVLDLSSQKWIHLKSELPSNVVLSVACDETYVYFGTTSGIVRLEKESII